ncbi:MAG TPA: hypothetical protein DDW42_03135 [Desulfobacteraceae bacterium]|nr:hypothetical protein [Desulfobacteraceae bacterium]
MRRKRDGSFLFVPVVFLTIILLLTLISTFAFAGEKMKDLPARGISVSPEYTGVVISQDENVSIDLDITNKGRRDEDIDLMVTSIPKGWKAWIKTYSFGVTGVHIKSDKSKKLTLRAEPGVDVIRGKHAFIIKAQTRDGKLTSTCRVIITVKGKKQEKKSKDINIITSYPVLTGPTDAKFEFSLEVENKLDKAGIFNLTSQGPKKWEINFKPAYEQKFISSLRLKAGQSQTVAVEVKPYPYAQPGKYPVVVKVGSPEAKGEATLTVVLTGTYKLNAGTANGLLSLNALKGEKANLSMYIKNSGSAHLNNIHFVSVKPENWNIKFSPDKIGTLAPEELRQVEVSITPTNQALVGDYSVGLTADAGKVSKSIELRVTVRASAAWAWIGIGIIVLVVLGLVTLFIRLGRR